MFANIDERFSKKDVGFDLRQELIMIIDEFIGDLYLNTNLDIVYDRVGKIQTFIHSLVDSKQGKYAHLCPC